MKKIAAAGAGVLVFALALVWLGDDEPENDHDRIAALITEMARLAGARDVGELAEHVSDGYRDANGYSKSELKRFLAGLMFRGAWNEVLVTDREIAVEGDTATVELSAVLVRGGEPAEDLAMGRQQISLKLAREGGEWRVVWAAHRRPE